MPWMRFRDFHIRCAPFPEILNFDAPLNFLSLNTEFPSIIIDAFPPFFSMFFIVLIIFLFFSKPLFTANSLDILITSLNSILFLLYFVRLWILLTELSAALLILFLIFTLLIIDLVDILPKCLQYTSILLNGTLSTLK